MEYIIIIPALLIALSVHEWAHAYAANKLGDPTPKMMGRVTLNPIKHLDPVGTTLLIVTILLPGPAFGWGKPVVFNPMNLKNPKKDTGIVAFAGPLSNILMALAATLLLIIAPSLVFQIIILTFIQTNIILAVFNMLPIYPLDGFNVVNSLLPPHLSQQFSQTAKYGIFALMILIVTGGVNTILQPILLVVQSLLARLI